METGILIRAKINDKWDAYDIADSRLPSEKIIEWLRSKGGANPFAENLLLMFLGREQVAHEVKNYIDSADAQYFAKRGNIRTWGNDNGINLQINPKNGNPATITVVKNPSHARVYNAMMHLIKSIQVHNDEIQ